MMQRNLGACSKRELVALFVMFCFRRVQVPFAPKSADHGDKPSAHTRRSTITAHAGNNRKTFLAKAAQGSVGTNGHVFVMTDFCLLSNRLLRPF